MDSIVLTLGHNSSAVAVRDGEILGGYEEERFTQVKADSRFPTQALSRLKTEFQLQSDVDVYLGHWFMDAALPTQSNKYMDYERLEHLFPCYNDLMSLSPEFSHHDSHLQSGMVFAGADFAPSYLALVMDGFGSFGECISVYQVTGKGYKLLNRWFGYDKSMGLLYQYATAYMGMKMHNHEYKMLAYEVHVSPGNAEIIRALAEKQASIYIKKVLLQSIDSKYDPALNLSALPQIQIQICDMLDRFCEDIGVDRSCELQFRASVSMFVQTIVETVVETLVGMYRPNDLLLVGGLFYNVKINSLVADSLPGRLCVMPLAGDQGAGLGVYQHYRGDLKWPGHLSWGKRDLSGFTADGIIEVPTMGDAMRHLYDEIKRIGFVNLVHGSMEFGPRALCNTSTLAIPSKEVTALINKANDRTNEMPMAPVVTRSTASRVFEDVDKVHRSLEYMIVTRRYKHGADEGMDGASHRYSPLCSTGRPQITDDPYLEVLLGWFGGALVNTSFNYHGIPIVFERDSIEQTHNLQRTRCPELNIKTVVVTGE